MNNPQKNKIYRHYKYDPHGPENNYTYKIIDIGFDTERQEEVVIYKPLYESDVRIFVRPLNIFLESVDIHNNSIPRFILVK
jgi:hypothetical protein